MGTLYGITLLVGGVLVLATVLFGGDADTDLDADMDVDVDADLDVDADADIGTEGHLDIKGDIKPELDTGLWLPVFSLRFWIFTCAFFGLTGVILNATQSLTGLENQLIIGIIAGVVGMFTGALSAYTFQWLKRSEANSMIRARHYVGRTAQVTLPFDHQSRGKIVLQIDSHQVDLIAKTDEPQGFKRNDIVNIIGMEDGVAIVVKEF